ncbi:hypothetical protein HOG17_00375 [Candidatus Peregrinibacteria bacterium]|jgi:hypothetical protein|nr:hypothetical protein [Candidatus Peregrinibacteria bacterium]MBT4147715.1 hypothetical protein [Candidatus Peregrinibacteria bacterium]MBT4365793.1 hypothetical protein [Candidatus Peregrinibacteria bacterium]MBT4455740.1 hypothetical protein [Candidatus Peregrinibacteria bacterium]
MTNKTKVIAAITIVLIAAGSVFFLSGTDLMGRMKFSAPKAYDEGRFNAYQQKLQSYQCADKVDNDGDGLVDYGTDPGCDDIWDNDEYNAPLRNPDPDPEPDPEPITCTYNGESHEVGATFDAVDECNTCTCGDDGAVTCGTNVCEPDPDPISLECGDSKDLIYSTETSLHTYEELIDFINDYKNTGQNCFLTFKTQYAQPLGNFESENAAKFLINTQAITTNNPSGIGKEGLYTPKGNFSGWVKKTNDTFDLTYSKMDFEAYNMIVDHLISSNYSVYRAQEGVLSITQPVTGATQLEGGEIPMECPVTPERFYLDGVIVNGVNVNFEHLRTYLKNTNQSCELLMVREDGIGTLEFSLKAGTNLLGVNSDSISFTIGNGNGFEIEGGVLTGMFEGENSSPKTGGLLNMKTDKFEVYRSSNFWN